jgi:hypothetical protein
MALPPGGSETEDARYAGVEVAEAILRLRERKKGPKLSIDETITMELFENIIGPITALEDGLAGEQRSHAMSEFLRAFAKKKKSINETRTALPMVAPKIAPNLYALVDRIDKGTDGKWESFTYPDSFLNDSSFQPLVSWLRYDINEWITQHS